MTCVVGLEHEDHVYIGADSAAIAVYEIQTNVQPKVFRNGPFVIAYTSSFRMGQIMEHVFKAPEHNDGKTDIEFLVRRVVPAIQKAIKKSSDTEKPALLLAYRGCLYQITSDYQVTRSRSKYMALGCGDAHALGSMFSTKGLPPRERIRTALQAATHHNAGVRPPYKILRSL